MKGSKINEENSVYSKILQAPSCINLNKDIASLHPAKPKRNRNPDVGVVKHMFQDTGSKGAREGSSTSTGGRAGRGNGRPGRLLLDGRPLGQTRQPLAARALRGMVVSSTDACQQPQREGQWEPPA